MEIINYGVKFFGTEIVAFDTLEDMNAKNGYDWLVICKRNPDNYGNGYYTVSLFDVNKKLPIEMAGSWKLKDIYGYWDWNNDRLRLSFVDANGKECSLCRNFRKEKLVDILIIGIETILNIGKHYTNALECELILWNTLWGDGYYDKAYWEACEEFAHNPIYQRQVSEEHKEQIQKEIYTRVDGFLSEKDQNYQKLHDRYTELEAKCKLLEEKLQSQGAQSE